MRIYDPESTNRILYLSTVSSLCRFIVDAFDRQEGLLAPGVATPCS